MSSVFQVGRPQTARRSALRVAREAEEQVELLEKRLAEANKAIERIREYAEGANPPLAECLNILFICQGWQRKA